MSIFKSTGKPSLLYTPPAPIYVPAFSVSCCFTFKMAVQYHTGGGSLQETETAGVFLISVSVRKEF